MPRRPARVREPIQVYLSPEDRWLLDELAAGLGVSRAEVLRRGVRGLADAAGRAGSPMLDLVDRLAHDEWPEAAALRHDELLAVEYLGKAGPGTPRRRR